MNAVGVDGWRGGWVAATRRDRRITWAPYERFEHLLAAYEDATVAVDMPIGVTDDVRAADLAAREWLRSHGGPWQSIFLTPVRATYERWDAGASHSAAMAARAPGTPGTSIQAWGLLGKIKEVTEAASERVIEVHPECSFREMDGRIGMASKKSGRGAGLRLRALSQHADIDLADAPAGIPVDDLLDAAAALWSAERFLRSEHIVLPAGATAAPRIVI